MAKYEKPRIVIKEHVIELPDPVEYESKLYGVIGGMKIHDEKELAIAEWVLRDIGNPEWMSDTLFKYDVFKSVWLKDFPTVVGIPIRNEIFTSRQLKLMTP